MTSPTQAAPGARRRAFVGSIVGHLVEWYDYGIYGYLAVFMGAAFFPSADPLVWCLKSKHQIIELAARATDARMVSALLRHTNGFGSWL